MNSPFQFYSTKDQITHILTIKRNINEVIHNRIYLKNFASKLMELLCDLDELKEFMTSEIIQVFIFNFI
jgi:hypothetical protein